jgi:hypothetical protein
VSPVRESWIGDETLPACLQNCVQQMNMQDRTNFLPSDCGHYLLDIALRVVVPPTTKHAPRTTTTTSATAMTTEHPYKVQVHIDSYRHSLYGQKRLELMKRQLESEIGRTCRRWRRIVLQREKQQESRSSCPMVHDPSCSSSMDES